MTNGNDSGPGSLRQAILDARDGNPTLITFDPSLQTINITTLLPPLTDPGDTIDGGTQVTLNGVGLTATSDHGLRIRTRDITISGLTLQNFGGNGIRIQPDPNAPSGQSGQTLTGIVISDNTIVRCLDGIVLLGGEDNNQIQVTITGNALTQNFSDGIRVNGSNNVGNGGNRVDVTVSNNRIVNSQGLDGVRAGDGIVVVGGLGSNHGANEIRAVITGNESLDNADEGIRVAGANTGSSSSGNTIEAIITGNITRGNGDPNGGNGITVTGGPTPEVPATTSANVITFLVEGNTCRGAIHGGGAAPQGNGISIRGNNGSGHLVTGTVSNNSCHENEGAGLQVLGRGSLNTLHVLVDGNIFDRNGLGGISATLSPGGNVVSFAGINNNLTRGNGGDGIHIPLGVDGDGSTPIFSNRADRNGGDGIEILGGNFDLSGNRADGNTGVGLYAVGNDDLGGNMARRNGNPICDPAGCF